MADQEYMKPAEVAAHYRTTVEVLRMWRARGRGPQFVKLGTTVLYPADAVRKYDAQLAQQMRERDRAAATG